MEDGEVSVEDLIKLKLIVVGNQETRKSSILNRFVKETLDENYQVKIGLEIKRVLNKVQNGFNKLMM